MSDDIKNYRVKFYFMKDYNNTYPISSKSFKIKIALENFLIKSHRVVYKDI